MASVHLARAKGIGGFEKLLVVKRILPGAAGDDTFVQMFLDEARIAATLEHSNIAHVFDVGAVQNEVFLVMEFLHGHDVRSIARTVQRALPLDPTFAIAIGMCAGLHYAHEKRGASGQPLGLVHRDVSPSNVVVTYDGSVKVIDFGIAKAKNRLGDTKSGILKGKPGYMSPEQCLGKPLDRRSDVFCVGIMLYELTTGTRLFSPKSDAEYLQLKAIVESDFAPPSAVTPGYPPELERIVLKALARAPDERYATALELRRDLEAFAKATGLDVSPTNLAAFMEATFREELAAWRSDERSGTSLAEHVIHRGQPTSLGSLVAASGTETKTDLPPGISSPDVSGYAPTQVADASSPDTMETAKSQGDSFTSLSRAETVSRIAVTTSTPPEETRRTVRRRRAVGLFAALALFGIAAAIVGIRERTRSEDPTSPAVSNPAPASTPITRLPLPSSTSREAVALFAEGMQANRDGASMTALAKFDQATQKDPMLAAAHLRAAILLQDYDTTEAPARYQRARELRQFMSEHDQALLEAVEPTAARPTADVVESEHRFVALAKRFPGDAEFAFFAATLQGAAGDAAGAVESGKRALAIDPEYMAVLALLGEEQAYLGQFDQALADLDRCMAASGGATNCLFDANLIRSQRGECDAAAQERHLATTPTSTAAERWLAEAAMARGEPLRVVETFVDRQIRAVTGDQEIIRAGYEHRLGMAFGDFVRAEAGAKRLAKAASGDSSTRWHEAAATMLADAYAEMGRIKDGGAVAHELMERLSSLVPERYTDDAGIARDLVPRLLADERRGGLLSKEELAEKRAAWLAGWEPRVGPFYRGYLWLQAYAETVDTREDAMEALEALPRYGGVPPFRPYTSVSVGKVYWLAGKLDEAIPLLEAESKSCTGVISPYRHTQSAYMLGRAREEQGNRTEACVAYASVLARWGHATPHSVTAEDVRRRMRALSCPEL
jgi:eukaryotic-like serine/threonine-protein kinase